MRKILALALMLIATSAVAAEHGEEAAPEKGVPGFNVDTQLLAPVLLDGKLAGYFYVAIRLTSNSAGNASLIREKLHFIQDAFVREVHARPILVREPEKVDRTGLGQRFVADAQKIVGPGKITGIIFGDPATKNLGFTFSSLRVQATPSAVPFEEEMAEAEAKPKKPATHH